MKKSKFIKQQDSRRKYKKYCRMAATRSKRGECWSKESLPIVYVDKSEITGTRQTANESLDSTQRRMNNESSASYVLQGKNK